MARQRRTSSELDALLKFFLGLTLGTILLCTTLGILYALIFVEQPLTGQSENDKMFFNVLGSVATFITGTLAGILIGKTGADEIAKKAQDELPPSTPQAPVVAAVTVTEDVPAAAKDPNYN